LITKIRIVAVTLLDALPAQDASQSNVQGIADYLLGQQSNLLGLFLSFADEFFSDFLSIMTSIESQFAD